MSVDLGDLIDSLKRETSPPGEDLFPNATDDDWFGNLADAFWEMRLCGMLAGYEEADGLVTPISGTTDLPRDLQQLVVLGAALRIVRNKLMNLKTLFKAVAGPVSFETQQSATLLRDVLADLQRKLAIGAARLSDLGSAPDVYIDAVIARDQAVLYDQTWWVR